MKVVSGSKGKVVNLRERTACAIRQQMACIRRTWNHFLALNIAQYETDKTFIFFHEMSRQLTELRKSDPAFAIAPRGAQTCVLQALDRALRDCGRSKNNRKGFPKFKSCRDYGAMTIQSGVVGLCRQGGMLTHVVWPKAGAFRVKGARLEDAARICFVTVRETANGLAVSLTHEREVVEAAPAAEAVVGIDLGLSSLVTYSSGEKISAPKYARKAELKLARAQRAMARKRKGSVNHKRARRHLARLYARVSRLRKNALHHISRDVVNRFAVIVVEDLNVKGLARTRLAKSIYDAGWGELLRQISYKAEWAGREVVLYGRYDRSTGVCPDCGVVGDKLPLSVRSWTCAACGAEHDRDVAAARVIALAAEVGAASPEPISGRKSKRAVVGSRKANPSASPPTRASYEFDVVAVNQTANT